MPKGARQASGIGDIRILAAELASASSDKNLLEYLIMRCIRTAFEWAALSFAFGLATAETNSAQELHFLEPRAAADAEWKPMISLGHYGKPPTGCEADEQAFQVSGVPGMLCAPLCDSSGGCPTDVPDGVSARPQCALENRATGDKFCVLICHEALADDMSFLRGAIDGGVGVGDAQCGDATCQVVQAGLGICTYP